MRLTIQRPPGQFGLVGTGAVGTWCMEGKKLTMKIDDGDSTVFVVATHSDSEILQQEDGFSRFENDPDTSLA